MTLQLSDEIYHILLFSDHMEIIKAFSLINKFWCEKARNIPLSITIRNFPCNVNFKCKYMIESLHVKDINDDEILTNIFESGMLEKLTSLKVSPSINQKNLKCIFENLGRELRVLKMNFLREISYLSFSSGAFSKLEVLELEGHDIGTIEISALENLKTLQIFCREIDLSNGYLPKLTSLRMDGMRISADLLRQFLQASPIEILRIFDCLNNSSAIEEISLFGHRLVHLNISCNPISLSSLRNLCFSSVCSNISELILDQCHNIGIEGCEYIGNGPALRNLTLLSLMYCVIGSKAFEKIVHGPNASNLKTLLVEECELGLNGCKAIAESKTLTNLTKLDISSNEILDEGCEILCNTPNLKHLTSFTVACNELTTSAPISTSPYLTHLVHLDWE
ncbi:predicted protein [Naegleria gruberi]|uniref:Predicted protein n=1 Tax=Naegleria gruberi TaxID=5762 RepID=D2VNK4_NAEGR|nr:uncharacterized protein NAEGRDRAFT_70532 [Naegleria gruberi]EFC41751.1 predicted protein [Naegleria gruberi]|eukprot:XP_002674495.1 predicted protein [Naegleria gruberi strain NEG-M]